LTSDWHPYLLVRPCGLPFIEQIRADLRAADVLTDVETVVYGWREVSRRLYFDQYGQSGTRWRLQTGAEAWLTTTVALYGDNAVCMQFASQATSERRTALSGWLADYKQEFRRHRRAQREQISVTFAGKGGSWPVYFDGVHVPEPQPDRIQWELDVILAHAGDAAAASTSPLILNA
jgi:hypothetical protein